MPPRLRAHSIAIEHPWQAARQAAAAVLADAPRGRPSIVVVARWGSHPGLCPSPWSLQGTLAALQDTGLTGHGVVLGERGAADPLTMRLATHGLRPPPDDEGTIALRPAGSSRPLRIPRSWLGRNLCLVLPCIHRRIEAKRGSTPTWQGPVSMALDELVTRWAGASFRDATAAMGRTLMDAFAHVSVVIDGSWWAPLASDHSAAPLLLAPERVLGLRLASPVTMGTSLDARQLDAWLGAQLGLPLRRPTEAVRVEGTAARTPWPTLPRSTPRAPGLAGKAVGALWRRADRSAPRTLALPPAVPGALAALWDEYPDDAVPR